MWRNNTTDFLAIANWQVITNKMLNQVISGFMVSRDII